MSAMARFRVLFLLVAACSAVALSQYSGEEDSGEDINEIEIPIPDGVKIGQETSMEDVRDEIIEDIEEIDQLGVKLDNALRLDDQALAAKLKENATHTFTDMNYKWNFLKEIYLLKKDIEYDVERLEAKWKISLGGEEDPADSLLNGLKPQDAILPEAHGLQPEVDSEEIQGSGDEGTEDLFEETSTSSPEDENLMKALITALEDLRRTETSHVRTRRDLLEENSENFEKDVEKLLSAIRELKATEKEDEYIDDKQAEVGNTKVATCSAMPESTWASNWIWTKKTESDNGKSCAKRIKDKANQLILVINKIHSLASKTNNLKITVSGVQNVLLPLGSMPMVGNAASSVRIVMHPIQTTLNSIQPMLKRIDNVLYPRVRDRLVKIKQTAAKVEGRLKLASNKCKAVGSSTDPIISRLCSSSNPLRQTAINIMEGGSRGIKDVTGRVSADNAYSAFTSTCTTIDREMDRLIGALPLPTITPFESAVNTISQVSGPLGGVFREIDRALGRRLCMTNPLEASAEAARRVARWAEDRREDLSKPFRGWRRKRNTAADGEKKDPWRKKRDIAAESDDDKKSEIFLTKSEAYDFLMQKERMSVKAGRICFSVKDILKGINSAFNFLLNAARRIINGLLSKIPGFRHLRLPNLPLNVNLIERINFALQLPDVSIDLTFLDRFPPALPSGV